MHFEREIATGTSRYTGFCNAAQAAISAATDTLYGCLALHRYSIMLKGNAPYPTRSPAKAAPPPY